MTRNDILLMLQCNLGCNMVLGCRNPGWVKGMRQMPVLANRHPVETCFLAEYRLQYTIYIYMGV